MRFGFFVLVALCLAGCDSGDPNWQTAVGKIEKGVTVHLKSNPEDPNPEPWFTVIEPYIETGGDPKMRVRYLPHGNEAEIDRRALMRSPAARDGLLVIPRG